TDGTTVAFDCGPQVFGCDIAQTGTYRLVVGALGDQSVGDYEIRFVDVPNSNENGALVSNGAVTGDLTIGDLDSFIFDQTANPTFQLRITDTRDRFTPEVWLYAPNGRLINRRTDGTTVAFDCGPDVFGCDVSQSGTYRIVVGALGDSSAGDYEVRLLQ
ncbi:MAG: hypothetical protein AAF346_24585, partial [Pseudomonadota bacterium]